MSKPIYVHTEIHLHDNHSNCETSWGASPIGHDWRQTMAGTGRPS